LENRSLCCLNSVNLCYLVASEPKKGKR